jgi:hypothetical protein
MSDVVAGLTSINKTPGPTTGTYVRPCIKIEVGEATSELFHDNYPARPPQEPLQRSEKLDKGYAKKVMNQCLNRDFDGPCRKQIRIDDRVPTFHLVLKRKSFSCPFTQKFQSTQCVVYKVYDDDYGTIVSPHLLGGGLKKIRPLRSILQAELVPRTSFG